MSVLKLKNSVLKVRRCLFWRFSAKVHNMYSANIMTDAPALRGVLKTCREVFCQTTVKISTKILKGVLQKYSLIRGLRQIEKCSGKIPRGFLLILTGVLQDCLGEPYILTLNYKLCKNSRTSSVYCYIMAFYFKRTRDNKQLLMARSFAHF